MVASNETVIEVIRVLRKHLDTDTLVRVLGELQHVEGNESFRLTCRRMYLHVLKQIPTP